MKKFGERSFQRGANLATLRDQATYETNTWKSFGELVKLVRFYYGNYVVTGLRPKRDTLEWWVVEALNRKEPEFIKEAFKPWGVTEIYHVFYTTISTQVDHGALRLRDLKIPELIGMAPLMN